VISLVMGDEASGGGKGGGTGWWTLGVPPIPGGKPNSSASLVSRKRLRLPSISLEKGAYADKKGTNQTRSAMAHLAQSTMRPHGS
jgi:hypothetical protein